MSVAGRIQAAPRVTPNLKNEKEKDKTQAMVEDASAAASSGAGVLPGALQQSQTQSRKELLARRTALAHVRNTVEISSSLTEDLFLKVGDAILFVELDDI